MQVSPRVVLKLHVVLVTHTCFMQVRYTSRLFSLIAFLDFTRSLNQSYASWSGVLPLLLFT